MDSLEPHETCLLGNWVVFHGRMVADSTCDRISWLVYTQLEAVAVREAGWTTLYRDPRDGRLWEHSHPKSEMHGGGPPMLQMIDETEFATFYYPASS